MKKKNLLGGIFASIGGLLGGVIFLVSAYGFLTKKKWVFLLSVIGIPLAVITAQQLGRFSLFSLAPISCLILVVLFVWPGMWEKIEALGQN